MYAHRQSCYHFLLIRYKIHHQNFSQHLHHFPENMNVFIEIEICHC